MTRRPKPRRAVPLHEPLFAGNEWRYAKECLDTGWVSTAGPFVTRFERAAARLSGTRHAVAAVNGTAALHLALRVAGVEEGDEVITQSLSFIATANSVLYQGATPRFLDAEEATFGLDPDRVEEFLSRGAVRRGRSWHARDTGRRIAACLPMHTFGHPARLRELLKACGRRGIPVIEDAAEAVGSRYLGRPLGSFGLIGVLSFNGNKIATSGGGGMLLTGSRALADRARHLSTQAKSDPATFWHDELGYNYRLPNLNAAVGLAQLERVPAFVAAKRRIAGWYRDALTGAPGVRLLWEPRAARSNFWLNAVICDSPARKDALMARLKDAGFEARPLWAPCHLQPAFRDAPRADLPVTERLWRTVFNLPSSANLTRAQVAAVARLLSRP